MSARLTHGGLPGEITPFRLKQWLRCARKQLGLSKGAVRYLEFALENCQRDDFLRDRICAIWHSLDRLTRLLGLTKRQIGRIEAELIRAGLVVRTYPSRKGRSGDRVNGVIKRAAGINLAPLIERAEQIRALAARQMRADDECEELLERIKELFRQIRELDHDGANSAATEILPRRRPGELSDIASMKKVAEALEAVLADFSTPSGQPEMSVESDKNVRLITNNQKNNKTRTAQKKQRECRLQTSEAQARVLAGQEMAEYIDLYACGGPPDWRAIVLAARDRAYELGIPSYEWEKRCVQLGDSRAALCLIVVDRNAKRSSSYKVENAAAAFIGLVRKNERQAAILDGLIGELTRTHVKMNSGR